MKNKSKNKKDPQLISYQILRRAVGILGIAFPVVLLIGSIICCGCNEIQTSISSYYHTGMRNIFVGILCAIALFMYTYNGYDYRDAIAGNLACIFALGVAFFPTSINDAVTKCIPFTIDNHIIGKIHYVSAAGLFLIFSYFSIFLFTIKDKEPTKMKLKRNIIYKTCGYIMLGCIVLIGLYSICRYYNKCNCLLDNRIVFWLESVALWAFGISWLIKGNSILKDKKKNN